MHESMNEHMNSLKSQSKAKIAMISDSQSKRLQPEKLSNKHHVVDTHAFSGMKIQQAQNNLSKCGSNIIIAHDGTNNIGESAPESLLHYIMIALNKIQKQNPSAHTASFSVLGRREHNEKVQKFNHLVEQ